MVSVYKVMGRQLPNGMWQYVAITSEGEQVIRKQATRQYANAYQYNDAVCSGNKNGLTRYFTFGKAPSPYYKDKLVKTHPVDFGEKDNN